MLCRCEFFRLTFCQHHQLSRQKVTWLLPASPGRCGALASSVGFLWPLVASRSNCNCLLLASTERSVYMHSPNSYHPSNLITYSSMRCFIQPWRQDIDKSVSYVKAINIVSHIPRNNRPFYQKWISFCTSNSNEFSLLVDFENDRSNIAIIYLLALPKIASRETMTLKYQLANFSKQNYFFQMGKNLSDCFTFRFRIHNGFYFFLHIVELTFHFGASFYQKEKKSLFSP